jgi:hypothetical protein
MSFGGGISLISSEVLTFLEPIIQSRSISQSLDHFKRQQIELPE